MIDLDGFFFVFSFNLKQPEKPLVISDHIKMYSFVILLFLPISASDRNKFYEMDLNKSVWIYTHSIRTTVFLIKSFSLISLKIFTNLYSCNREIFIFYFWMCYKYDVIAVITINQWIHVRHSVRFLLTKLHFFRKSFT